MTVPLHSPRGTASSNALASYRLFRHKHTGYHVSMFSRACQSRAQVRLNLMAGSNWVVIAVILF